MMQPAALPCRPDGPPGAEQDGPGRAPRRDGFECLFVWGVWLAMSAAAAVYVLKFGSVIPYADEWNYVPALSGAQPCTCQWLWQFDQEHRMPAAKAAMWASFRLARGDLRLGMLFSVALLAATALGLTVLARRIRGRMSFADAFFPLALLHWQHAEHFIHFFQINYVLAVAVYCGVLIVLASGIGTTRLLPALLAGAGVFLLPLQGARGLAYTPAVVVAAAGLGVATLRGGTMRSRRNGVVLLAAALATCLLIAAYFVGYPGSIATHSRPASMADKALGTLACANTSLGALGARAWPVSAVLLVAAVLATLWVLGRAWQTRPDERPRVFGLVAATAAAWSLALAIGVGRAGLGADAPRYCILTVPILLCIYIPWCRYGPVALGRFLQMVLFAAMCAFSTYHASVGMEYGKGRREADRLFWQDVAAGVPMTGLVGRHAPYWCWAEAPMRKGLQMLHDAGIDRFGEICSDPPMHAVPLPLQPTHTDRMALGEGTWQGNDRQSSMTFLLGEPRFVYAVRLEFFLDNQDGTDEGNFECLWPRTRDALPWEPYQAARYRLKLHTGPKVRTQSVWVNDTVDRFVIRPGDRPFTFRLEKIELLLPGAASAADHSGTRAP